MKIVLQRVLSTQVEVNSNIVGKINKGYLVFLGVGGSDSEKDVIYLAEKVANLRIMPDEADKMNRSLKEVGGELLVVSQFTLYGETKGQNRPSFITAAKPELAKKLYRLFIKQLKAKGFSVQEGVFGTYMKVSSINDGPVTLIMESANQIT